MLKFSKLQLSLISLICLLVLGQIGYIAYHSSVSRPPIVKAEVSEVKEAPLEIIKPKREKVTQASAGKAFGLINSREEHFQVDSVKELRKVFNNNDYSLQRVKKEGQIPRLFLAKFPKDMKHQKRSSNSAFIQVVLPYILRVNEEILQDRQKLLDMKAREKLGHKLTHHEKMWLSQLAAQYRCKSKKIDSLLVHVDIVPPSLALAQATLETGGGRSYAAVEKNSLFGHMATKTKVQAYESILHSVKAYIHNLNRHTAYRDFRIQRAALRAQNSNVCGYKLATCLTRYSERGAAYTRDLQKLIDARGLRNFDSDHITLQ